MKQLLTITLIASLIATFAQPTEGYNAKQEVVQATTMTDSLYSSNLGLNKAERDLYQEINEEFVHEMHVIEEHVNDWKEKKIEDYVEYTYEIFLEEIEDLSHLQRNEILDSVHLLTKDELVHFVAPNVAPHRAVVQRYQ